MVFRGYSDEGEPSITFPAGELEQAHKAMDVMVEWFRAQGKELRMHLVQEQEFALLKEWYPGSLQIAYDRDAADYVYETEKLTTLAGKKLHGKRNHINKFKEGNPDWVYEPIGEANAGRRGNCIYHWGAFECRYLCGAYRESVCRNPGRIPDD